MRRFTRCIFLFRIFDATDVYKNDVITVDFHSPTEHIEDDVIENRLGKSIIKYGMIN